MNIAKESIESELSELISTMNIPETRRTLTDENIRWMLRNLGIQNGAHMNFDKAMQHIISLSKKTKKS